MVAPTATAYFGGVNTSAFDASQRPDQSRQFSAPISGSITEAIRSILLQSAGLP